MKFKNFLKAAIIFCLCILSSTTAFAAVHFVDVNHDAWYYEQVTSAAEKGYMSGVGENNFLPDASMTRAMFAQLLANFTEGYDAEQYRSSSIFSDVKADDWYAPAVNWATKEKIVTGTSLMSFSPEDSITRQEMAVMIYNYAKAINVDITHSSVSLSSYSDYASIDLWAVDAMDWAVEKGIITGTGTSALSPVNTATRAQVATVIINAENIFKENKDEEQVEGEEIMKIAIKSNGNTIIFELNDSQAAKDLYAQLPLTIQVQNYSTNEKIFYPPESLNTKNAAEASGNVGSLAYYEPWGNVVMFYKSFNPSPGGRLYELGKAISGSEHIQNLTGDIEISKES